MLILFIGPLSLGFAKIQCQEYIGLVLFIFQKVIHMAL